MSRIMNLLMRVVPREPLKRILIRTRGSQDSLVMHMSTMEHRFLMRHSSIQGADDHKKIPLFGDFSMDDADSLA